MEELNRAYEMNTNSRSNILFNLLPLYISDSTTATLYRMYSIDVSLSLKCIAICSLRVVVIYGANFGC